MKTRKLLLFMAAVILTGTGTCFAGEANVESEAAAEGQSLALPLPLPQIDHPYERVDRLFTALPSGASLNREKLTDLLGSELAAYLSAFAVSTVTANDGKVTISLARDYAGVTQKGTRIQAAKLITLSFRREGSKIILEDIVGIKVKPRLLFVWLPVTALSADSGNDGLTILEAALHTVLGNIGHTVKLGADGKPIK